MFAPFIVKAAAALKVLYPKLKYLKCIIIKLCCWDCTKTQNALSLIWSNYLWRLLLDFKNFMTYFHLAFTSSTSYNSMVFVVRGHIVLCRTFQWTENIGIGIVIILKRGRCSHHCNSSQMLCWRWHRENVWYIHYSFSKVSEIITQFWEPNNSLFSVTNVLTLVYTVWRRML